MGQLVELVITFGISTGFGTFETDLNWTSLPVFMSDKCAFRFDSDFCTLEDVVPCTECEISNPRFCQFVL